MFLVIPGRVLRSSHISHTAVCSSKIQNVCSRPTVCQTQNPKGGGEDRKGTDPVAPVVLVLWVEWARREGRGARVSEVRNATSWERCSHGTLGAGWGPRGESGFFKGGYGVKKGFGVCRMEASRSRAQWREVVTAGGPVGLGCLTDEMSTGVMPRKCVVGFCRLQTGGSREGSGCGHSAVILSLHPPLRPQEGARTPSPRSRDRPHRTLTGGMRGPG